MVAPGDAFQQYFWGDKNAGYDVLLTNMKQAVSASKEFHEILRERGNYEEAFSKSLRRLSEKATTINAVGSFLPVWTVVKKYMENMSKIHGDFSTKFKELCQELNTFKTDSTSKTNKMLKDQADVVKTAAALNNIKNSLEHVNKCKKLYQQKHKDLIESEESFTKAGLAADKTDKETEKMQQKFTRSQDAFVLAENTYKASVEKYNKAQEEYNEDMTNSCKFFGEMEQTHLNLIVEFAKRFGDIETDLIEELKKNCESILGGDNDEDIKGLVGYTPEHLIKIFVEEKTTGVEMCPLMETELLTVKDPPVLSMTPKPTHNPAPHEKSSDSGSVNSIPNAHNATTVTTASVVPPANMNSMTLAMSNVNVGLKQFRKMIKPKKKPKNKNEGDNKSIDSKTEDHENGGDDISEKSTSEHDSAGHRSELDFYERHGTGYFSSDEDEGVGDDDSDEDGLTAKVRTIKIRNTAEVGGTLELPTEEELRKATEKLTLSCLSPNTLHRDRSKTHNPQLFSAYSHSLVDLPVSPEPAPKTTFPTTFNTPRAKSVSGHISSPRAHPRNFPAAETNSGGGSDAWAVFDDSFKTSPKRASDSAALDSAASWSTPPTTKRILFEEHKIEQEKVPEKDDGLDGLLEFAPTNLNTPEKAEGNRNLDDLLSITLDDQRAMSPASEYMVRGEQEGRGSVYRYPHLRVDGTPTLSEVLAKKQTPDGSPTNSESNPNILVSDETGDMKDGDKVELDEETGARRKRLPSLIEFSPVKPLLIKLWWDRAASKRQSTTESPTSPPPDKSSSSPSPEREITPSPEREMSPPPETPPAGTSRMRKAFERNKMTGTFFRKKSKNKAPAPPPPESQEASDPLSSTHRSEEDIVVDAADPDTSLSPSNSIDTDSGVAVDGSMPPTLLAISNNDIDVEDSKLLSPLSVDSMSKVSLDSYDAQTDKPNGLIPKLKPTYATVTSPPVIPYLTKPASTEDVEFSAQHEETVENDREEIPYPIAIAIIETASAVFKPNDECTSKIEGELIMSLPCDAAADLAINPAPPPLKIRLVSTTTPNSFIVNRQIFSIKPPSILDILEVNMNLLQNFLKKRLEQIGKQQRINIPLLKYKSPYLKAELAPLIAQSYWTTSGDNTVLSIDASVNESLAVQNFHFPRITYSNSFDSSTPVLSSHPSAEISNNKLRWERYDVGNEMLDHPDRLIATFEVIPNLEGSRTDIEFEVEGVVISGTDVVLENSESYSIATTVKKMKSDKYWTEPKIMDSNC
ncbi:uncharacterized protein LOC134820355 isoform X15 [Bolinopsis microptera]|uniref:uncharacterized protein LOC134820355 isoform X15 n=1 Tax=Bolinopsis microptera TaxID=2820187 RepID=UPI00307959F0